MTRPTVRLVERRTRAVRLPREDAAFLLANARDLIDVQPTFDADTFRLTPRGHVGFLDGPTRRFEIAPKIPWPNVFMLLGVEPPAGDRVYAGGTLLAALAHELADRIDAVTRSGLVGGYHERECESAFLRGRLRTAEQLKDAAARAFPDRFHIVEDRFDLDTPWNRVPKVVAESLLTHPDVPTDARQRLAAALTPFAAIGNQLLTTGDFDAAARDPRLGAYAELLALCRVIHDGLPAADPTAAGRGGFLVDLGRAFERYLTTTLTELVRRTAGWTVEAQPRFVLGGSGGESLTLQPDLILRRGNRTRVVLDAKWKRPGPDAGDLHQILAYAAITGAPHVALVYPGRKTARRELRLRDGLRLSLFRLQVVGSAAACRDSAARVARALQRR